MVKLSEGCLSSIMGGNSISNPVVQLLGYKKMAGDKTERYRLLISDGKFSLSSTMLATQLNHKVTSGELENNAVIQITRYICNQVNDKKIVVVLDLSVLETAVQAGGKIGNPMPLQQASTSNGTSSGSNQQNSMSNGNQHHSGQPTTPNAKPGLLKSNVSPGSRNVFPISSLNPYQNRWTIRARVTNKSNIRTWSNSKGEGKLFSVDLIDESGEIRATGFNEQCDQYYDLIEINKVYYFSKATLKSANKQFTSIKNDYEMTFNNQTEVSLCNDQPDDLPVLQFNFIPINSLESYPKDSLIDVIGVCKSAADAQTIVARTTGKELIKRDLTLVDKTNTEIQLTLWADSAVKFDGSRNPVVAVKGARLSDFNGRSLSSLSSSVLHVDPDIKEAYALRGWYDSEGINMMAESLTSKGGGGGMSNWKTFLEVNHENLGQGSNADYYSLKGTIAMIKHENALYKACPSTECNKKVIDMNNGLYRCEKCNQEYPNFKYRLLLQAIVSDFSSSQWVTFFQESAETIIGMAAQELGELKDLSDRDNDQRYLNIMTGCCFKSFIFKFRAKMETFNEENRLKTVGVNVTPINPVDYSKKLIGDIKKLSV